MTSILLLRSQGIADGSGRLICGWLGVVIAWQADLSGWLGATGRPTGGVLVESHDHVDSSIPE